MRDVQTRFPRGKAIRDRYIVEDLLGTGGFGAVYRVRDRRVKENVFALKEMIDPSPYERSGFAFESDLLKRLDHPALPHVYRVFEDNKTSRIYMLMDYIDGPNLERLRLQQPEKRLPFSRVMKIMEPIIDALSYLHTRQPPIIHRDIKPSNIIVPVAGDGAVLVDFGIAKEYDQDSTTTAIRHCSPGYGAPEHYAHGTNTRTDIYSLAATFYTVLTGKVPIDALYRMTQLSSKGVDPLEPVNELVPSLPQSVAEVIRRAMAINSNDRFATVEEFWQALKACDVEEEDDPEPVAEQAEAGDTAAVTERYTPALSVEEPGAQVPEKSIFTEPQTTTAANRHLIFLGLVAVVLVALFAGLIYGIDGQWAGANLSRTSAPVPSVPRTAVSPTISTRPTLTSSPTVSATRTPAPTVAPTQTTRPTPSAGVQVLEESYSGTIIDRFTTPPTEAGMSLSQLRQHGARISGYFSVGPGLIGNGSFTGTITPSGIQFLVPGSGSVLPLFFSGQIQPDGSITGTYCSYQNNQCNFNAGGHGDWHVAPQP